MPENKLTRCLVKYDQARRGRPVDAVSSQESAADGLQYVLVSAQILAAKPLSRPDPNGVAVGYPESQDEVLENRPGSTIDHDRRADKMALGYAQQVGHFQRRAFPELVARLRIQTENAMEVGRRHKQPAADV